MSKGWQHSVQKKFELEVGFSQVDTSEGLLPKSFRREKTMNVKIKSMKINILVTQSLLSKVNDQKRVKEKDN